MSSTTNLPSSNRVVSWFNPRGRTVGTWAFIINRLAALGLTFYLFMHLIVLGQLARGPDAYDNFIETIHNPFFIAGELLVVFAGLFHGLNGLRIALTSFGIAVPYQRQIFYAMMIISILASVIFGVRMFSS